MVFWDNKHERGMTLFPTRKEAEKFAKQIPGAKVKVYKHKV